LSLLIFVNEVCVVAGAIWVSGCGDGDIENSVRV